MAKRNITLSLPDHVLEEARVVAVRRHTSVSALMAGLLEEFISREKGYRQAERRFLELMEDGFDMGTGGGIGWSRDEVHDR